MDQVRLIRLPEVMSRVSLRRATIYRRISKGDFPKPVRTGGRASAWVESEVDAWIADRIAERERGESNAR